MSRFVLIGTATLAIAVVGVGATGATPAPSTEIAYVGKIPKLKTYALYTINSEGSDREHVLKEFKGGK